MCFSVLLLAAADSSLPDPKSAEAVGWMVATIGGIMLSLYYALAMWKMLFPTKTPPDNEVFATKAEVAKLELEHEDEMKRIEKRFEQWLEQQSEQHQEAMRELRAWRDELHRWQMGIENVAGKIDTKAEFALHRKAGK